MNRKQKAALTVGLLLVILFALFPPWDHVGNRGRYEGSSTVETHRRSSGSCSKLGSGQFGRRAWAYRSGSASLLANCVWLSKGSRQSSADADRRRSGELKRSRNRHGSIRSGPSHDMATAPPTTQMSFSARDPRPSLIAANWSLHLPLIADSVCL